MYDLYFWYAWDFGRWIKQKSSDRLSELTPLVKGKRNLTYKIEKDGVLFKYHEGGGFRVGMISPPPIKSSSL